MLLITAKSKYLTVIIIFCEDKWDQRTESLEY